MLRSSLLAAVIVLSACSPAGTPAPAASASAITLAAALDADRAFAAAVKEKGPKAAFLDYFHPDSEFFAPGAVTKGAPAIAAGFDNSPPGFLLEWTPESGHDSAGGNLAVTTGRYTIRLNDQQIDAGRYFTIWRPDAAGALKVIMDGTIPDPPAAPAAPASLPPDPEGRPG